MAVSCFETVESEALALSPVERETLAQRLLGSLDGNLEIEEAWAVEVERRAAEIESGVVELIPMDVALAKVRAKIK